MKKFILLSLLFVSITSLFARDFTISIGAGENWKEKREPQIAVWIEDSNGTNVKNLYVTQRASKKNWIMGPKNGRPESLPVWYNSASNSNFDAVTSPTPKGGVIFTTSYDFADGEDYCICVELNNSFDYNQNFPKKADKNAANYSGVNGQPSVIYKAKVNSNTKGEVVFELAGTGSLDGSDGKIHYEIGKLTTAKNIAKLIVAEFK